MPELLAFCTSGIQVLTSMVILRQNGPTLKLSLHSLYLGLARVELRVGYHQIFAAVRNGEDLILVVEHWARPIHIFGEGRGLSIR